MQTEKTLPAETLPEKSSQNNKSSNGKGKNLEQRQSDVSHFQEVLEDLYEFSNHMVRSTRLLHWLGYGLLILAFFDLVELLIPPGFMNPNWEFQFLGQMVERVPVPLIGFALVFFGRRDAWSNWEIPLLKVLSWLTLLCTVLFFLSVPLGAFNTYRLNRASNNQIKVQLDQGREQIAKLREMLANANTPDQLEGLLRQLDERNRAPEIKNFEQFGKVKEQLSDSIDKAAGDMEQQAKAARSQRRQTLLKSSVKWNLGALVAGALFGFLWKGTGWARRGL